MDGSGEKMMKRLLYPFWRPNWIKSIHFRKYAPGLMDGINGR
jgi:hypothetical protein